MANTYCKISDMLFKVVNANQMHWHDHIFVCVYSKPKHNMKFTKHIKVYDSGYIHMYYVAQPSLISSSRTFSSSKINPMSIRQSFSISWSPPPRPPPAISGHPQIAFYLYGLVCSGYFIQMELYDMGPFVHYFFQGTVFKVHLCCSMHQYLIPLYGWIWKVSQVAQW